MLASTDKLAKRVKVGNLLTEYDIQRARYSGVYIVLGVDDYCLSVYQIWDEDNYNQPGDIYSLGHGEVQDTRFTKWEIEC
jgi:hypothetical protein